MQIIFIIMEINIKFKHKINHQIIIIKIIIQMERMVWILLFYLPLLFNFYNEHNFIITMKTKII